MWSTGVIGVPAADGKMISVRYQCKHYDEPSFWGIDEGRISKLWLSQNGRTVYNFDREVDVEAQTPEAELALAILMKEYN